jgi:hypothetical protein
MTMSDKGEQQKKKLREQIAALVEPGETVRHAVVVTKGLYGLALGVLPALVVMRFRHVALTDKALYVISGAGGVGPPKEVKQRIPLPAAVSVGKSLYPFWDKFVIGDQKFHLSSRGPGKAEAESLAAAAASAPAPAAASAP